MVDDFMYAQNFCSSRLRVSFVELNFKRCSAVKSTMCGFIISIYFRRLFVIRENANRFCMFYRRQWRSIYFNFIIAHYFYNSRGLFFFFLEKFVLVTISRHLLLSIFLVLDYTIRNRGGGEAENLSDVHKTKKKRIATLLIIFSIFIFILFA